MVLRLSCTAALLIMGCGVTPDDVQPVRYLVINEFMADNRGTWVTDEYGDADDWIELYNNANTACNTGALFCSDDSTRLQRYALPDTVVPPGGYLLFWADGEVEQGIHHAPFKLSAEDGEEIILSDVRGKVIDRIQFFPRNNNPVARVPDRSYGREHDGDTVWVQQFEPSPGYENTGGRR